MMPSTSRFIWICLTFVKLIPDPNAAVSDAAQTQPVGGQRWIRLVRGHSVEEQLVAVVADRRHRRRGGRRSREVRFPGKPQLSALRQTPRQPGPRVQRQHQPRRFPD